MNKYLRAVGLGVLLSAVFLLGFSLVGCGYRAADLPPLNTDNTDLPPFYDPYMIVDRTEIMIDGSVSGTFAKITIKKKSKMWDLIVPKALAYTGVVAPSATLTAITYNNPATVVGFTLGSGSLTAGSFTGDILSFGNFAVTGLDDNKLKVCPAAGEANNGTVKCNKAKIRVYSATGSVDGVFNNTTDGYYIPMSVEGINVGVGVANAAYVQVYTIAANKNRLRASDLTAANPNFPVTIDFSNGGAGSYTGTLVVEYVLIKE